ncbi:unnamed protein product, partial [Mesorhabditis spiculigera]
MNHWTIYTKDRDEWRMNYNNQTLQIYKESDHPAKRMTYSVSDACFQRYIDYLMTSPVCTIDLDVKLWGPLSEFWPVDDNARPRINATPLFRSFRAVRSLSLSLPNHTTLRTFQANSRCGADVLLIQDGVGDMSDIVRCRRCRMHKDATIDIQCYFQIHVADKSLLGAVIFETIWGARTFALFWSMNKILSNLFRVLFVFFFRYQKRFPIKLLH